MLLVSSIAWASSGCGIRGSNKEITLECCGEFTLHEYHSGHYISLGTCTVSGSNGCKEWWNQQSLSVCLTTIRCWHRPLLAP